MMTSNDTAITIGLEACVAQRPAILDGARFGVLMNRASVDGALRLACDVLADAYPGQLAAIFTPQHGLWGDVQANMIETPHSQHARLGIPIYSLYSETRRPTPEMLADLECLVVDLQDVGTRVYTFAWTMRECLIACSQADVPVLVLDRPNPIGGTVEGPLLDTAFCSFVGGASLPMRHGLTLGELGKLLNRDIGAELEVVPLSGWSRSQLFPDLGRDWIPPSPNLPTSAAALVYAGQVLLEGTNLSEGRGTTTPFQIVGAPFLHAERFCDVMTSLQLPGIHFLPVCFRPTFDKWAGDCCNSISLHVGDTARFRPYQTTVSLIAAVRCLWPDDFEWIPPPYEYETDKMPIDILSGNAALRTRIEEMSSFSEPIPSSLYEVDTGWSSHLGCKIYDDRRDLGVNPTDV